MSKCMRLSLGLGFALAMFLGAPAGSTGAATAQTSEPVPIPAPAPSPSLPGGASTITETHGDWTVNCQVINASKVCRFSHQQFDQSNNNQRLLAIELVPLDAGTAGGTLALPFGLALAKGVSLAVDDAVAQGTLPFSTCLIVGCLIPVSFDKAMVDGLKAGAVLKIGAFASDTGQPINFAISLRGFGSALARTATLAAD